jgi:Ala-tRNA(Pro) deacylase
VEPGGVPPFGNLFGLRVITDENIFENEEIIFNAGDRRVSIALKSEDYRRIAEPEVSVIAELV